MRTARAQGMSVNALARRFRVHRGTVWAKTRNWFEPGPRSADDEFTC